MEKQNYLFIISISLILLMFMLFFAYENQIQNVPIHYGLDGKVTKYGYKSSLIIMLVVNIILLGFIFILSKNPDKLNYPIDIDSNNKASTFRKMQIFLGIFSIIITSVFFIIFLNTIKALPEISNIIQILIFILFAFIPVVLFVLFRKSS